MKDYTRNVVLLCSVCGNDQFATLDGVEDLKEASDDARVQCADCQTIFTKRELLDNNQHIIEANIDEVEAAIIADFEKKLKKIFK